MFYEIFYTVLFCVLCESRIQINITTGSNTDDAKVIVTGFDNKLITDKEIRLYNFTKVNLNRGIRKELGKAPDDVFWLDPTPYGDLFKKFKWPQVQRHVESAKAKIIHIINENVVLKVNNYVNTYDNKTVKFKINESEVFENTLSSSWSKKGLLNDKIHFDVNVKFNKRNSFHYEDTWGNNSNIYAESPFGISEGYKTALVKPGQTVTSKLSGLKTIILIEIEYLAKLIGNLVLDYEELYGKYHFYSPTVNNIMRAAKMSNDIRTTQWMEVRCYSDPTLEVYDKESGEHVQSIEHKHIIQVKRRVHAHSQKIKPNIKT